MFDENKILEKKICIIDDDIDFAKGLSDYFEDSGYEVIVANDEIKGFDLIKEMKPNIVFLDLGLKNVSGIEVLKQIKMYNQFLPVIIISGTEILHEAVEAVKQGADDFISKPILELKEVEICVAKALEKNNLKLELNAYKENLEKIIGTRTKELNEKTFALERANKSLIEEIERRIAAEEYIKRGSLNIINALEEERKRLSLDLHDSFGPKLMFAKISLELYEKELSGDKIHLKNAIDTINKMSEEIRFIIKTLYPQSIDKYALTQNIKTLIKNFEEMSDIKFSFDLKGTEVDFDPKIKLNVYRVFQEAFNNIIKHSKAKNVTIKLNFSEFKLNAEIKDDGVGFILNQNQNDDHGTGLFSMNERIKHLNGEINIFSEFGKGSQINFEIPLTLK